MDTLCWPALSQWSCLPQTCFLQGPPEGASQSRHPAAFSPASPVGHSSKDPTDARSRLATYLGLPSLLHHHSSAGHPSAHSYPPFILERTDTDCGHVTFAVGFVGWCRLAAWSMGVQSSEVPGCWVSSCSEDRPCPGLAWGLSSLEGQFRSQGII